MPNIKIYKSLRYELGLNYDGIDDIEEDAQARYVSDDFFDSNYIDHYGAYYIRRLSKDRPPMILYAFGTLDVPEWERSFHVCRNSGLSVRLTDLFYGLEAEIVPDVETDIPFVFNYYCNRHLRKYSDERLLEMYDEYIHDCIDVVVIDRIYRLDSKRLSEKQLCLLEEEHFRKITTDRDDIELLLEMLKNVFVDEIACREYPNGKKRYFMGADDSRNKNLFNAMIDEITTDDVFDVSEPVSRFHLGCCIIRFRKEHLRLDDGNIAHNVEMRLRIYLPGWDNSREGDTVFALIDFRKY